MARKCCCCGGLGHDRTAQKIGSVCGRDRETRHEAGFFFARDKKIFAVAWLSEKLVLTRYNA
jgi:hypothetical protein